MKTEIDSIKELKIHLKNCNEIMNNFIKKYNIVLVYLNINDTVSINTHSSLNLIVNSEFDDFKVSEIKKIKSDLYESFRKYLEVNEIPYTLHIYSQYNGWAVSKIVFKFEITN